MKSVACIAVIPAYREADTIGEVVRRIRDLGLSVIVVDDGSDDATAEIAFSAGATVLRHSTNLGKGAALQTGIRAALEAQAEWIITLDGDGQHDPADLPALLDTAQRGAFDIVCGNRMANPRGMPWIRRATNHLMSRWISRATGQEIPDSQCGFRAYRAGLLQDLQCKTSHFEWESEVLVRASALGARIGSCPIRTIYGQEQSKIRPIRDTLRFWRMWRALRRELRQSRNR